MSFSFFVDAFNNIGRWLTPIITEVKSEERQIRSSRYETNTVKVKAGADLTYYLYSSPTFDGRKLQLIIESSQLEALVQSASGHYCHANWMNCHLIDLASTTCGDAHRKIQKFNAGEALAEILGDLKINDGLFAHLIHLEKCNAVNAPSINATQNPTFEI